MGSGPACGGKGSMLVNVTCPLTNSPGAIRIPATLVLRRDGSIAGIKIAQNEGDTIAVPVTPVSSAPVPGQMATSNFPVADSIAAQKESFPVAPHDKEADNIPESLILSVENFIAMKSKFKNKTTYDKTYKYLPEINVNNTEEGYDL